MAEKVKVLLCMPGKMGDIVWTLPAARQLHRTGREVHYLVMPKYAKVARLLESQSYVESVRVQDDWLEESDQCGAQPRIPPGMGLGHPLDKEFPDIYFIGYESRPQKFLVLHAFSKLGLHPEIPFAPFIEYSSHKTTPEVDVAYAFSDEFGAAKAMLVADMRSLFKDRTFMDVSGLPLTHAAEIIAKARMFLGCRSLNYVIAMGVGQRCVTFEPNDGRRGDPIFSFPWGTEQLVTPGSCAQAMSRWLL